MTATTQLSRLGVIHRAGWLLVLFIVAAAGLPTPRATAADTICVALVVDFSPLGGNVDSGCTKVPSGSTGEDVLRAGGHSYGVCDNGIIGTIDGQPANGCQVKDNTHFWGYWHRKPGSSTWTFSNYGAATYRPVEGSTEGWVWENGSTTPPANVPYPANCHSPSPSPTPTPRTSSRATTSTTSPATSSTGSSASSRSGGPTTRTAARSRASLSPRPRAPATPTSRSTPSEKSPTAVTTASTPAPTGLPRRTSSKPADDGSQKAPLLAGVGVAAVLGGGAWWRFRRPGPG
ncbi:MAG TPA: hypothetical protein VFH66_06170 [Mycobacteriales bacterium]|nr:hypothetical protein [Mycobacteriales bacterium]